MNSCHRASTRSVGGILFSGYKDFSIKNSESSRHALRVSSGVPDKAFCMRSNSVSSFSRRAHRSAYIIPTSIMYYPHLLKGLIPGTFPDIASAKCLAHRCSHPCAPSSLTAAGRSHPPIEHECWASFLIGTIFDSLPIEFFN